MGRWIPALAVAAMLPATAALGQFADETQSLFSRDRTEPRAWSGFTVLEFDTADAEETEPSGALSIGEICCGLPETERETQAICIGVELACD